MGNQYCKECLHFLQHYSLNRGQFFRVYCGHCTHRRAKRKRPDAPACDHFTPGPNDADAFVTKEYLSKELLEYILRMELLPEIDEAWSSKSVLPE